jgi:hypothetical protein
MAPDRQVQDLHRSQLYQALKQVLSLLQTTNEVKIEALQLGLSVAVYEVGHSLATQASQTLSYCQSMLIMLEHNALDSGNKKMLQTLEWLKASLLLLDRYVKILSSK